MTFWVLQSEAQREHIAAGFLKQGGFETYLPRVKLKANGRTRLAPLFPTYLFVAAAAQWYPARWTPHVTRILMAGDRPADLSDDVVEAIQRQEGKDGFVRLPKNGLQLGQTVCVVKGALTGQFAIYDGMLGADRCRVLLAILGRMSAVLLPTSDIVSVEAASSN